LPGRLPPFAGRAPPFAESGETTGSGSRSFSAKEETTMVSEAVMRHRRVTAAIFGVILIGLGAIFILDNLGYVDAFRFWEYWPVALIGFGLASLIAPKDAGDPASGAVLAALGTFFLLRKLDVIDWRFRDVWPMFLIVAGVALIARSLTERQAPRPDDAGSLSNGGAR
jgi:hypothetical protein